METITTDSLLQFTSTFVEIHLLVIFGVTEEVQRLYYATNFIGYWWKNLSKLTNEFH